MESVVLCQGLQNIPHDNVKVGGQRIFRKNADANQEGSSPEQPSSEQGATSQEDQGTATDQTEQTTEEQPQTPSDSSGE